MSKAGSSLLRTTLVRAADTARKQDPQLARVYYLQMVERGKDRLGATCVVAANLAERAWTVMRRGEPYVIRDTDGRPVTPSQAKAIIDHQWTVPRRRAGTATLQEGEEGPQERPHGTIETSNGSTGRPSPQPILGPRQLTVKPRTPVRPKKILGARSPIGNQSSSTREIACFGQRRTASSTLARSDSGGLSWRT